MNLPIFIIRLNVVLTYGIPPEFRSGVHFLFKPSYAIGSVPSTDGVHRRKSIGRGPVNIKVV